MWLVVANQLLKSNNEISTNSKIFQMVAMEILNGCHGILSTTFNYFRYVKVTFKPYFSKSMNINQTWSSSLCTIDISSIHYYILCFIIQYILLLSLRSIACAVNCGRITKGLFGSLASISTVGILHSKCSAQVVRSMIAGSWNHSKKLTMEHSWIGSQLGFNMEFGQFYLNSNCVFSCFSSSTIGGFTIQTIHLVIVRDWNVLYTRHKEG